MHLLLDLKSFGKRKEVLLTLNCSLCTDQQKFNPAIKLCITCEEFLCKDCVLHHKTLKPLRDHVTTDLEKYKQQIEESVSMHCSICQELASKKESAVAFCTECDAYLCKFCTGQHEKRKATSNHRPLDIAEYIKMQIISFRPCDNCPEEHPMQVVYYCTECDKGLCKNCSLLHTSVKKTKNHTLVDIADIGDDDAAQEPIIENQNQEKKSDERPSTPTAHNISTDSITLKWNKPQNTKQNIVGYDIRFRDLDSTTWRVISTGKTDDIETISQLKGDTAYEFKVRANYGDEDGPYSNISAEIRTTVSLAKKVIKKSRKIEETLKKGQPVKYKIPLNEPYSSRNDKAKTRKLVFGQADGTVPEKTIMVVGATGAGKSTLIDGMINFILDVSFEDDFRFTVIDLTQEEMARSTDQSQSQTEWITSYKINLMEGCQIYYTLNLIDTPGFGDTRGIERDKKLVDQIREFFNTPGDQGITTLDAVCFVTQAPLARLSPTQKYIFDSILSVFGNDIVGNIFALITFADGKEPPVLEALKSAKVPIVQSFLFNNSALWEPNKNLTEASFSSMFWKLGRDSFKTFFTTLASVEPRSLQLTSEVLRERKQIENLIQGLRPQIDSGLSTLETLRQERKILLQHQNDIKGNKNFTYEVDKPCSRQVKLTSGTYVTNCLTCNMTCHENCGIPDDKDKARCLAMKDGYCTVCPQKCYWNVHKNNDFKYETYIQKVKGTYDELKKRYDTALAGASKKKGIVQAIKDDFAKLSMQVADMMGKMRKSLQRLTEIALKPNPLSDVEYINILIESEKREAKPGFLSRVNLLEQLKKDAELIQNLPKGDMKVFGDIDLDELTDPDETAPTAQPKGLMQKLKFW